MQAQEFSRQVIGLEVGSNYRILVVEDKQENRQLLVELLTSVGFEVREATNGQWAGSDHTLAKLVSPLNLDGYANASDGRV
jgi:PleD family two-component response regulator